MIVVTEQSEIEAGLIGIFGGDKVPEAYPWRHVCRKCKIKKDSWLDLDRHHITYNPDKLIWLCRTCHIRITHLNRREARALGRALDNEDRLMVFEDFMNEQTTQDQYKRSIRKMKHWIRLED